MEENEIESQSEQAVVENEPKIPEALQLHHVGPLLTWLEGRISALEEAAGKAKFAVENQVGKLGEKK